jgi:hypothetical protein
MEHGSTTVSARARRRQLSAAIVLGLLVSACGGPLDAPAELGETPPASDADLRGTPPAPIATPEEILIEQPGEPVATPDPVLDEAPTADPIATPEPVPGPVATPEPEPVDAVPGAAWSWTKPADFDGALASAIAQQPSYMDGYGGQVANPFPQIPGTTRFSGIQVTRTDAIVLGNHFGRPSFRFYVDPQSRHSNGLRAEFIAGELQYRAGDTYEYRFSSYFAPEYRNSAWTDWNLFAQFHGPGFPAWGLHTAGGYLHMQPPGVAANTYRITMPSRGRWHDFRWTIRWAKDSTGYATLDVDGVRVFEHRGATMHASEPYYYPKFGSYLANNAYTQVTYSTPWTITPR